MARKRHSGVTVALDNALQSWNLALEVSEPFEYGFEPNPNPILVTVIETLLLDSRPGLLIGGFVASRGRNYREGVATARYTGSDLLADIERGRGCTVNAAFYPEEIDLSSLISHAVTSDLQLCWSDLGRLTGVPDEGQLRLIGTLVRQTPSG